MKREVKRHSGQPQPSGPGQGAVRGDQGLMSLLQSKTGQAPGCEVRLQSRYCTFAAQGPGGRGWVLLHLWRQRGASESSVGIPQGCCHLWGAGLCVTCSGPNCYQESLLGQWPGLPPHCATVHSRSRWQSLSASILQTGPTCLGPAAS